MDKIGQCETVEAMKSDIARISDMNELFDDVDRSGSGIAMFRYVDLRTGRGTNVQWPASRRHEECH